MSDTRAIVLAMLLLSIAIAPAAAAAQEATSSAEVRPADLVVRQESYVSEGVDRASQNGTPVYSVRGEQVWIRPSNFAVDQVVDFGVDRGAGELALDDGMGAFTFSSEGEQASFTLYWIVLEERQTSTSSSANNSTSTNVQRVRYEATIRVVGLTDLEHAQPGEISELRNNSENWEQFNDTVQDVREMDLLLWQVTRGGEPPETEALIQGMINTYVTSRDPLRLLTGGFFEVIVILTLSLGGLLWLALREGLAAYAARKMRKRLNIYKATESDEGEISDRLLELDRRDREQIFANLDFQDFGWTDHEASAYRQLGDTPREAFERIITDVLVPEILIRERLQAMAGSGYTARVTEREDGHVSAAEIVREDHVDADEDDVEGLEEPSDELVEALFNDPVMLWDFNPATADFDVSELKDQPKTLSVDEALEALRIQVDRFEDDRAVGKLLQEHVEWAAKSSYTDEQGRPLSAQRALNSFLETASWLSDVHSIPSARILAEHLERALLDYDPGREAREYGDEIREGRHA